MLGHGQEVEDPAAAVVDADDLRAARPRGARPASRRRRAVAPAPRSAPRWAGRWRSRRRSPTRPTPSIPFAPRLARKRSRFGDCGKQASTSRIGIDELTQTSASSGSSGQRGAAPFPRTPSGAASTAAAPSRPPPASRRANPRSVAPRTASPPRTQAHPGSAPPLHAARVSAVLVGSCHAPCGSITICGERRQARAAASTSGMSPTRSTRPGRPLAREVAPRGAARRSGRSRESDRGRRIAPPTSVPRGSASRPAPPGGSRALRRPR